MGRERTIDPFSTELMQEDGFKSAAAPECKGQLGWVYRNGFCYLFTSYHETFLKSEEECNKVGGYLADVLDNDENNWIKSVLNVINPKDVAMFAILFLDDKHTIVGMFTVE